MNLTSRTYLLAALTALLGVVETWSEPVAYSVWRLAAALLVAGALYEWLVVRVARLRVSTPKVQRLALGRPDTVTLAFANDGHRPLSVMFAPALPEMLDHPLEPGRVDVAPESTVLMQVPVTALGLGEHPWPRLVLRVLGPLGLGWWPRRCGLDATVHVVPDLLRSNAVTAGSVQRGGAQRAVAGGSAELRHLREYRPGDSRHTIDWKATARAGSLVTRVYQEDQHLEIMVILDAGRTAGTRVGALSQLGHFVNATARFAEHAAASEDRVGLVAVADRLVAAVPPQRGLSGVQRIRQILGTLDAQPVETDLLAGVLEVQRLVRHRSLVIVLTDLYGQDTDGRLARSVGLLLPRHLPVVVGLVSEELSQLAHGPALRWIDPYRSLAAREYQTRVWRNAAGLRRQGARTLVTTPDALDARVLALYRELRAQRRI